MMFIKKLGAVLATIGISVIRIPLSLVSGIFNRIDYYLIKIVTKLCKVIDCDLYTEAIDHALYRNYTGFKHIAKYFKKLAYDLHN